MSASSEIVEFFRNKAVFLTGATGFLGKLTLERLLRVCRVRMVYILVRPKRGKCETERCKELFNEVVFEKLRNEYTAFEKRIKLIAGDCAGINLNISDEDWALLHTQVEVILHCAASVNFGLDLRSAFNINVRSVRDLIINARKMKNLQSFVHVSTAYSNCHHERIEERSYAPPMTAEQIENLLATFPDDFIKEIEKIILGSCPNNYIFTKCIAEEMIERMAKDKDHPLSISIMRPSMITCTYKEPIPGWIDNTYGPVGVILGISIGLVHTLHAVRGYKGDMVPGDYVVNALLAVAWNVARKANKCEKLKEDINVEIYNYTSDHYSLTWETYLDLHYKYSERYISINTLWIPFFWFARYKCINDLLWFLFHTIPANVFDTLLTYSRRRPKYVRTYQKLRKRFGFFSFFGCREWKMPHNKILKLFDEMNEEDRKQFELRIGTLKWHEYIPHSMLGVRENILKEPMSNIERARKRYKKILVVSYILKGIAFIFCCSVLYIMLEHEF